jgi:two-component system LytT family response regulator
MVLHYHLKRFRKYGKLFRRMVYCGREMKKTLSCIIVDDSLIDSSLLQNYLEIIDGVEVLGVFSDSLIAIKEINQHKPDIVLSDIEMPGCSGIELAKSLNYKPAIIFLSNHPQFGAETYEAEASGYLVKPVALDKFTATINKVIEKLNAQQSAASDIFIIRTDNQYIPINKNEIAYIEAEDKFVKIHLINGQQHIVWISLKSINEQLEDGRFIRIHRSFIINTNHIQAVNNIDVKVNNRTLPLSEQYKPELFETYVRRHLIKK